MRETTVRRERSPRGRHAVHRPRRVVRALFALAVVAIVGVVGLQRFIGGASTSPTSGFYLVVGASASLGFQPTGIVHHNGARTDRGYADDVVAMEQKRGVDLTMRQIGCPGETTYSMLHTGDHCYVGSGSQRNAARIYLGQHHDQAGLITIDLGFNDVRPCLWKWVPDSACVAKGLAQIRANLPGDIKLLQTYAGAHVHFVGLLYADPFLSDYVNPHSGAASAEQTRVLVTDLDNELTSIYRAANIPIANVPGAFHMDNVSATKWDQRPVPTNVLYACSWTWMCTPPPWGPDDHPNDAGYRAIANAIEVAVPTTW